MYHQFKIGQLVFSLALLTAAVPLRAQENPSASGTATGAPQPPPAPLVMPDASAEAEVTVEDLVRRALENNPQLPIARQTEEAARQRLAAQRGLANPLLSMTAAVGDPDARDEDVILAQPLDLFGQRHALAGVAAAELRRARAETTLAERTLIVAVKNAAAGLFAAQEAEALGTVQVEVARLFRDAAARRAELGDVPPVQVQRADLELLRVQNELTNAQAERQARRAALNELVVQPPEMPLRVALPFPTDLTSVLRAPLTQGTAAPRPGAASSTTPAVPGAVPGTVPGAAPNAIPSVPPTAPPSAPAPAGAPANPPSAVSPPVVAGSGQAGSNLAELRGQLLPGALTNRPDVVAAQATLEARRAQVNVISRQRLPIIELQVRRAPFFPRQGAQSAYALRAVVTLPVFDFGSIRRERRATQAEVRAQEATINLLRSQVATQVEQALLRLEQQRQTVERYRAGIVPISIDLLRKTQIGYAAGASTYLEVLEAQRTLRQVQTEYLQALVATRTNEAALESALGAAAPTSLAGTVTNPTGPTGVPGVAAPGTVPEGIIPPVVPPPAPPPAAPPASSASTNPQQPGGNQ